MPDESEPPLVLVIEDDFLIAIEQEARLLAHGWCVLGPAASVAEALALLAHRLPDVALLDFRLGDEVVTPVAQLLHDQGVPFVLCSTTPPSTIAPLVGVVNIGKPFIIRMMLQALEHALAGSALR